MANSQLENYIKTAREQKASDADIKAALLKAGWREQDVTAALAPQISHIPPPPPPPEQHFGMWVAFEYIIFFISLYIFSSSIAGLLHDAVDKYIPDPLQTLRYSYSYSNSMVNFYSSALIVSFPFFAGLLYILGKQAYEKPAVKNLRARKLLIYITLVGTFIIMIGHLIFSLSSFFKGDLMIRIFAHLGVTFFVAGSIFGVLLYIVREDRKTS